MHDAPWAQYTHQEAPGKSQAVSTSRVSKEPLLLEIDCMEMGPVFSHFFRFEFKFAIEAEFSYKSDHSVITLEALLPNLVPTTTNLKILDFSESPP